VLFFPDAAFQTRFQNAEAVTFQSSITVSNDIGV
jgi:hypothetical protein